MPKTARSRSPGASQLLTLAGVCAALLAAHPALADDYADGARAFAARDYAAAAAHWQAAARAGSAEASLQLGLMADVGLGMPGDPARAFGLYLDAARLGQPDAAFNVGVMLDAGTGVARDPVAAGIWYARAVLAGNRRAAFNLGLLYRDGSGVPANADLAAYWLGVAADTIPAAKAALQRLRPADAAPLTAPVPLAAEGVQMADGAVTDLVWTAAPGPPGAVFSVQVVWRAASDAQAQVVWLHDTLASAVQVPLSGAGLSWRVARIDPASGAYLTSPWQHPSGAADGADPRGLVTILVNAGDLRAAALAGGLARGLRGNGLVTRVATAAVAAPAGSVRYRFPQDGRLARDLAGFLPGFAPDGIAQSADLAAGPGEVVVQLVLTSVAGVSP